MKLAGRFVARTGKNGRPNLVLGLLANDQSFFKADTVYEMIDTGMGEIILREVGPTAIGDGALKQKSPIGCHWSMTINDIIEIGGNKIIMTREEAKRSLE